MIASALGAVLVATIRLVTAQSLRRGAEDVAVARSAFNRLVAARTDSAAAQVRLITALPVFRSYMTDARLAGDAEAISAMADDYRRELGASFTIVTDREGAWMGKPGWRDGAIVPTSLRAAISSATSGQPRSLVTTIDGGLFLVAAEPARFAQEVLGTMTVGFTLDDALARELTDITHCEVSLVSGPRLVASSVRDAARVELATLIASKGIGPADADAPGTRRLGNKTYVVGAFPLTAASEAGSAQLVLLRDWAATQQFIDQLQRQFALAGLLVFVCALVGGFVFSRRTSRPFRDIAAAARDIATGGHWSRQVPVRGSAEATTMASAFNEMTTSLRHWYEEAQAKSAHLEASYERFHSVTESARDAIVSTDERGAIVFWNRAASMIFGYEEGEIVGKPIAVLIAPADRERCAELLSSRAGPAARLGGRIIEIVGQRRDGVTFPIELSWQADGRRQVTAIIRDISERKQAEEALRQRGERLQQGQKMEAIGRLAGGVAHDFNNLLMAIIGFGNLVRDDLKESDPKRSDIDEVLSAAARAATLTSQLLAFSRRQVVTPQVIALDQVVARTEEMLRRLIGQSVTLTSVIAPGLGRVRIDPGQIEQLLVNLCVNARDAMPAGGELRVDLSNGNVSGSESSAPRDLQPGRHVCLAVSDTGSGIDPDVIDHIFEPFFTTKPEGKGSGLGLATVYGIARQAGGHVDVESRPGHGTTFRVYFPRLDSVESSVAVPAPEASPACASETVLLVEDDDRVRRLVANLLRRRGYTVLATSRGDEALEVARRHEAPIHLLLSDVVMPGMSGRVVAARVTEIRPDTRVLLMSGYSDDAILRNDVETARLRFIQKPFSPEALAAKIREALET